jgi:hypothetical protein
MCPLFRDEKFDRNVVLEVRRLGHDVFTADQHSSGAPPSGVRWPGSANPGCVANLAELAQVES